MMTMFALLPSLYSTHLIGRSFATHLILYGDLSLASNVLLTNVMKDGDRTISLPFQVKSMQVSI